MKKLWMLLMAVLMACAGAAAENEDLSLGMTGPKVLELNTRLRQLNYTATPAVEVYSDATKNAVMAVQKAYGLEETGIADGATQAIIYGECYRPLSQGDNGLDVQLMQEKLTELGYYWGKCSGNFLEGTTSALETFQREHGLEVTGRADVDCQEKLYATSVRPTPTPVPEGEALEALKEVDRAPDEENFQKSKLNTEFCYHLTQKQSRSSCLSILVLYNLGDTFLQSTFAKS